MVGDKPIGTCYEDAWRFLIREEEGELVHGSVQTIGKRINHAWVELPSFVWEPRSGEFIKKSDFYEMAEELKNKDKTIEELGTENKGLKEDKVISEVTSKLTTELDQRLPKPGAPGTDGSGQGKLFKAIEDVVAKKLEQLLGGSNTTLTSEQIRTVVKEEVGAVAGGNKKPEDMVDDLVNALTIGDKLREKLKHQYREQWGEPL